MKADPAARGPEATAEGAWVGRTRGVRRHVRCRDISGPLPGPVRSACRDRRLLTRGRGPRRFPGKGVDRPAGSESSSNLPRNPRSSRYSIPGPFSRIARISRDIPEASRGSVGSRLPDPAHPPGPGTGILRISWRCPGSASRAVSGRPQAPRIDPASRGSSPWLASTLRRRLQRSSGRWARRPCPACRRAHPRLAGPRVHGATPWPPHPGSPAP
jgi:hypothetical protein